MLVRVAFVVMTYVVDENNDAIYGEESQISFDIEADSRDEACETVGLFLEKLIKG